MISIEVNPALKTDLDLDTLERAALTTLASQDAHGDISIVLTDDAQLQQLNREYLSVDAPTDVLSFPASETDPETGRRYLGDILISISRANEQALAAGHALEEEVQLLIVHATLHLLGHDHAEAEEKAHMWKAQAEVLARIGLPHIQVRE
ncbi:MAG: rRNA maturation RNase YbeY [Anaerolineales bacterium]